MPSKKKTKTSVRAKKTSARKVVKKAKKIIKKVKKVTKKTVKKAIKKQVKKVAKKQIKPVGSPAVPIPGKKIGEVTHWYGNITVAIIKLNAPLSVGDRVMIVRGEERHEEIITSMQIDHAPVEKALKGAEVGVLVKEVAHEGADVYRL